MENNLTATHHTLDFNLLSPDKFSELCYWLVEDSGEYKNVEYYEGTGDKKRDVIGYTYDEELDYFQCKRYDELNFSILKEELDTLSQHIIEGTIKKPRQVFFVLSSKVSPDAKDKLKIHAKEVDLPEPIFWEPVILDRKTKNNPKTLKNFFNISEKEEILPEVDVDGIFAVGTTDSRFTIVNTGEKPAIECTWSLIGFNFVYKTSPQEVFNLKPGEKKDLRVAISHDFMKLDPTKELRLHFEYRDNKNNWYYSERFLGSELVPSQAFYAIKPTPGAYVPARPFHKFLIDNIDPSESAGLLHVRIFHFKSNGESHMLKIIISDLAKRAFNFNEDELNAAFEELAKIKIQKMISAGIFESELTINQDKLMKISSHNAGFDLYKDFRESL